MFFCEGQQCSSDIFHSNPYLEELEIVEVLGGIYVETGMKAHCTEIGRLDPEAFLPLALGRADYWPALATARLTKA